MTTPVLAEEELLPCPFKGCNGKPTLTVRGKAAGVQCRGKTHLVWAYGSTAFEAIENWNTRATRILDDGRTDA